MSFNLLKISTGELIDVRQEMEIFIGVIGPSTQNYRTVASPVFTGSYAFVHGSGNNYNAGYSINPSVTELTLAYYHYHHGYNSSTSVTHARYGGFFQGVDLVAGYMHQPSTNNVSLTINNVDQGVAFNSLAVGLNTTLTWMHLGFRLRIDGINSFFSMYLDGELLHSYTGTITGSIDNMRFRQQPSGIGIWSSGGLITDDLYLAETIGEPDIAPSSKRFLLSLPNGVGANSQFSTEGSVVNYENVDENPNDGNITYNKSNVGGDRDTFVRSPIIVPLDHQIRAAIPFVIARKTDAGTDSRVILHSYDGMTYQSSISKFLPITYSMILDRQPTQPDTTNWTEADFNSAQSGYEAAGDF